MQEAGEIERFYDSCSDLMRTLLDALADGPPGPGHDPAQARWAINTHAFFGRTPEEADSAFAHSYLQMMNRIGRERGWTPSGRPEYDALRSPQGALAVGSPEQVAEKILHEHELFGNDRYVGQMSVGAVAHRDVMRSIELFATEVVRRSCGKRSIVGSPTPASRPRSPSGATFRRSAPGHLSHVDLSGRVRRRSRSEPGQPSGYRGSEAP